MAGEILHVSEGPYALTVDYGQSMEELVKAGKYDYSDRNITSEHFEAGGEGQGPVEIVLIHFDRYVKAEEVVEDFRERAIRPSTARELLAFGAKYSEIQRMFPIVALGSAWRTPAGDRYVVYLWGDALARRAHLGSFGVGWGRHCRFAAVREQSSGRTPH